MKLIPRLKKSYKLAAPHERLGLKGRPYLLPVFGLVLGAVLVGLVFIFSNHQSLRPSSSHVVLIFDNGKEQTVDTREQTVGSLLGKLPLNLIKQDVVEPDISTQIIEDNFRINIYRARPVTVEVSGKKSVVLTGERSARVIAQEAGLQVYPEDDVSFAPGQVSQGELGEVVTIKRSRPVYLNLYGTALTVRTTATTVGGLLDSEGIKLGAGDSVQPKLSAKLSARTQVFLLHKGAKIVTVARTIPAPTKIVDDPTLTFGISAVRQPGQAGERLITYEVDKHGHRRQIQAAIVQDPVPKIIARGTNSDIPTNKQTIMADAGLSPADYDAANYIISNESGWCYTKWQGEFGYCPAYHGNPGGELIGYGLCQSTPANKMATAGADWAWNPVTQMKWCTGYADSKYGGWAGAYNFWFNHHYW